MKPMTEQQRDDWRRMMAAGGRHGRMVARLRPVLRLGQHGLALPCGGGWLPMSVVKVEQVGGRMLMVAALFVQRDGCYYGLDGVDPWDEERDARLYNGPHSVVAHPPCQAWGSLSGFREHMYGYKIGDDGGCFESALNAVRRFGGVIEHPAKSRAWKRFGLMKPPTGGGWVKGRLGGRMDLLGVAASVRPLSGEADVAVLLLAGWKRPGTSGMGKGGSTRICAVV